MSTSQPALLLPLVLMLRPPSSSNGAGVGPPPEVGVFVGPCVGVFVGAFVGVFVGCTGEVLVAVGVGVGVCGVTTGVGVFVGGTSEPATMAPLQPLAPGI